MDGEKRNAYIILRGKPEGQRPLGRPRHRCVCNVTMVLREIGWNGMDCIELSLFQSAVFTSHSLATSNNR
jgi:hypothetical protein